MHLCENRKKFWKWNTELEEEGEFPEFEIRVSEGRHGTGHPKMWGLRERETISSTAEEKLRDQL